MPKRLLLPLLLLLFAIPLAEAAGFQVLQATTRLEGDVYRLQAKLEYQLSAAAGEALHSGVPLTVAIDMEVRRRRKWAWDESVYSLAQRFRLEYHSLSQQYLVTNLNSGVRRAFPSQEEALHYMGQIKNFPLLDKKLLEPKQRYKGALRARLDLDELPTPLRLFAYISDDWRLSSAWRTWKLSGVP